MMQASLADAIGRLCAAAEPLRELHKLGWPPQAEQAADCLRMLLESPGGADAPSNCPRPTFVAVVGGASSGKSTVFNNLLGGRATSRVTAAGHATLGLIAAVHDDNRSWLEAEVRSKRLLPTLVAKDARLEADIDGEPSTLYVVHHSVDALRDVVLFDTPDFSSEPARIEGDVTLMTLPWHDGLIAVVDHERWFDRQAIGRLRDESVRFGQRRFVVFNRGQSGRLPEDQKALLAQQARRLDAEGHLILDFRPGRGCCTFPPGTLSPVLAAVKDPPASRRRSLLRFVGHAAADVLRGNDQRLRHLTQLRQDLDRAVERVVPSTRQCVLSLLTPRERKHLDVVARTLRIHETKQWLEEQAGRLYDAIRRRLPLPFGARPLPPGARSSDRRDCEPVEVADGQATRQTVAWELYRSRCLRTLADLNDATAEGDFWKEVRDWTGLEPRAAGADDIEQQREAVVAKADRVDEAIAAWAAKVEAECRGTAPHVIGAVGVTAVAATIVLVAVGGPIGALTLPAAKLALTSALGTLLTGAGAGALAGRPLGRLLLVVHEKLLGSPEYDAVAASVEAFRGCIADFGRRAADALYADANRLTLPPDGELVQAMHAICDAAEID